MKNAYPSRMVIVKTMYKTYHNNTAAGSCSFDSNGMARSVNVRAGYEFRISDTWVKVFLTSLCFLYSPNSIFIGFC